MNIIVAMVGAIPTGYFLSPIFKLRTINDAITIPTRLVTLNYPKGFQRWME